ncbi:hypothetical protein AEB_P1614 [Altererythrobacter sp. B11]|nr:hypothetical protein AEB_P1614 [Altererythrobacter sp. B11]
MAGRGVEHAQGVEREMGAFHGPCALLRPRPPGKRKADAEGMHARATRMTSDGRIPRKRKGGRPTHAPLVSRQLRLR